MIAIHSKTGSFAAEWLKYCKENEIPIKQVDCFSNEILQDLSGCSALLWHWEHYDYRAQVFARQLIASAEKMGIVVFPSTETCWHYDDKVGQKYLLEAIGAPIVPTHIFYEKKIAHDWVQRTTFPKVWKLRCGAGSQNVRLVSSRDEAHKLIKKSFSSGWKNSRLHPLRDRIWNFRNKKNINSLVNIWRGVARAIIPHDLNRRSAVQKDYVYFQDFIPDNDCDIRVIIIGGRAFAIKRMVRDDDFRASGSGLILYERSEFPEECIRTAFEVTDSLDSQSCAFDFVSLNGQWLIVEISYAFNLGVYKDCPGFWDRSLNWYAGPVTPERYMLEDVLKSVGSEIT